jgi:hypothetical protein
MGTMAIWNDPVLERFYDRWQKRGELMATVGGTAIFTWLASALPTAHQTHVSIWPPLFVGIAVVVAGIYAIAASDNKTWWLPGRRRAQQDQPRRMVAVGSEMGRDDENARKIADALNALGESLKQIAERLSPEDRKGS